MLKLKDKYIINCKELSGTKKTESNEIASSYVIHYVDNEYNSSNAVSQGEVQGELY